uniref:RING-type domain-containing protein n=1 Tax=Chromera velia CCMP2878 TaxID=1169474 RepID=A0A0G4I4F1_9ALVE|eukprot:Cvel_10838.t1-p1 / transcript=Cvel_10838.t1 / gene=Cvel_10838 / organism=Chromera_velia_CCMP2878 / gene_product=E3 ubiquitin-protein ligase Topors, putative / transcript_product=E3 ubiquitin-protein ligase Topors, putative / location=Cvel_scaffold663:37929-45395(-) / protein_length=1888 / sequence_SO=supercontig / SO=protein_coding / is_pseudo=false
MDGDEERPSLPKRRRTDPGNEGEGGGEDAQPQLSDGSVDPPQIDPASAGPSSASSSSSSSSSSGAAEGEGPNGDEMAQAGAGALMPQENGALPEPGTEGNGGDSDVEMIEGLDDSAAKEEADEEPFSCVICMEENVEHVGTLDTCIHEFCFKCIHEWSRTENTCPVCKARFRVIRRTTLEEFLSKITHTLSRRGKRKREESEGGKEKDSSSAATSASASASPDSVEDRKRGDGEGEGEGAEGPAGSDESDVELMVEEFKIPERSQGSDRFAAARQGLRGLVMRDWADAWGARRERRNAVYLGRREPYERTPFSDLTDREVWDEVLMHRRRLRAALLVMAEAAEPSGALAEGSAEGPPGGGLPGGEGGDHGLPSVFDNHERLRERLQVRFEERRRHQEFGEHPSAPRVPGDSRSPITDLGWFRPSRYPDLPRPRQETEPAAAAAAGPAYVPPDRDRQQPDRDPGSSPPSTGAQLMASRRDALGLGSLMIPPQIFGGMDIPEGSPSPSPSPSVHRVGPYFQPHPPDPPAVEPIHVRRPRRPPSRPAPPYQGARVPGVDVDPPLPEGSGELDPPQRLELNRERLARLEELRMQALEDVRAQRARMVQLRQTRSAEAPENPPPSAASASNLRADAPPFIPASPFIPANFPDPPRVAIRLQQQQPQQSSSSAEGTEGPTGEDTQQQQQRGGEEEESPPRGPASDTGAEIGGPTAATWQGEAIARMERLRMRLMQSVVSGAFPTHSTRLRSSQSPPNPPAGPTGTADNTSGGEGTTTLSNNSSRPPPPQVQQVPQTQPSRPITARGRPGRPRPGLAGWASVPQPAPAQLPSHPGLSPVHVPRSPFLSGAVPLPSAQLPAPLGPPLPSWRPPVTVGIREPPRPMEGPRGWHPATMHSPFGPPAVPRMPGPPTLPAVPSPVPLSFPVWPEAAGGRGGSGSGSGSGDNPAQRPNLEGTGEGAPPRGGGNPPAAAAASAAESSEGQGGDAAAEQRPLRRRHVIVRERWNPVSAGASQGEGEGGRGSAVADPPPAPPAPPAASPLLLLPDREGRWPPLIELRDPRWMWGGIERSQRFTGSLPVFIAIERSMESQSSPVNVEGHWLSSYIGTMDARRARRELTEVAGLLQQLRELMPPQSIVDSVEQGGGSGEGNGNGNGDAAAASSSSSSSSSASASASASAPAAAAATSSRVGRRRSGAGGTGGNSEPISATTRPLRIHISGRSAYHELLAGARALNAEMVRRRLILLRRMAGDREGGESEEEAIDVAGESEWMGRAPSDPLLYTRFEALRLERERMREMRHAARERRMHGGPGSPLTAGAADPFWHVPEWLPEQVLMRAGGGSPLPHPVPHEEGFDPSARQEGEGRAVEGRRSSMLRTEVRRRREQHRAAQRERELERAAARAARAAGGEGGSSGGPSGSADGGDAVRQSLLASSSSAWMNPYTFNRGTASGGAAGAASASSARRSGGRRGVVARRRLVIRDESDDSSSSSSNMSSSSSSDSDEDDDMVIEIGSSDDQAEGGAEAAAAGRTRRGGGGTRQSRRAPPIATAHSSRAKAKSKTAAKAKAPVRKGLKAAAKTMPKAKAPPARSSRSGAAAAAAAASRASASASGEEDLPLHLVEPVHNSQTGDGRRATRLRAMLRETYSSRETRAGGVVTTRTQVRFLVDPTERGASGQAEGQQQPRTRIRFLVDPTERAPGHQPRTRLLGDPTERASGQLAEAQQQPRTRASAALQALQALDASPSAAAAAASSAAAGGLTRRTRRGLNPDTGPLPISDVSVSPPQSGPPREAQAGAPANEAMPRTRTRRLVLQSDPPASGEGGGAGLTGVRARGVLRSSGSASASSSSAARAAAPGQNEAVPEPEEEEEPPEGGASAPSASGGSGGRGGGLRRSGRRT